MRRGAGGRALHKHFHLRIHTNGFVDLVMEAIQPQCHTLSYIQRYIRVVSIRPSLIEASKAPSRAGVLLRNMICHRLIAVGID